MFDGTYGAIGTPLIPNPYVQSIDFAFKTNDIATNAGQLSPIFASSSPAGLTIGIDDQGRLAFRQAFVTGNSGFIANDDKWHWARIVLTSTSWEVWVDDALLSTGSGTFSFGGLDIIGMRGANPDDNAYWKGELAHVVTGAYVWNQRLYGLYAYGADHYTSGGTFYPETLTDAANAILRAAGWPADWTNFNQGYRTESEYTCGGQKYGKTALSALQEVNTAEAGRMFIDGSGVLQFQYRDNEIGRAHV